MSINKYRLTALLQDRQVGSGSPDWLIGATV
jgi:hypothetical protein